MKAKIEPKLILNTDDKWIESGYKEKLKPET